MGKKVSITEEEREKCRKVIDAFEELYEIEDENILFVDAGRYGFVKLQCYTPSYGFEELDAYTDSGSLFEGLWEECLNLNVFLLASEMQLADVLYDDLFNNLPKEKQSKLIGRKDDFAKKAGITQQNEFCGKKALCVKGKKFRLALRMINMQGFS